MPLGSELSLTEVLEHFENLKLTQGKKFMKKLGHRTSAIRQHMDKSINLHATVIVATIMFG